MTEKQVSSFLIIFYLGYIITELFRYILKYQTSYIPVLILMFGAWIIVFIAEYGYGFRKKKK